MISKNTSITNIVKYILNLREQNPDSSISNWNYINIIKQRNNTTDFLMFYEKVSALGIANKEYTSILGISTRKLNNVLKGNSGIPIDKYEKALRIFVVMIHGIRVFGNQTSFAEWLKTQNPAIS